MLVKRLPFLILAGALLYAVGAFADAQAEPLSGKDLKAFVAGRHVYLKVPLGGEVPLLYSADGTVDGSGESAGLGRFLKPTDTGRWWVEGENLCQKWSTWYNGKRFCFTVDRTSETTMAWTRDDGYSGTARIGR